MAKIRQEKNLTIEGADAFSVSQSKLRIALCRECLNGFSKKQIRIKNIYREDIREIDYCRKKYAPELPLEFDEIYKELYDFSFDGFLDWKIDRQLAVGSFLLFVRFESYRSIDYIDEGAIWLGGRDSYPRIFVENDFCNWWATMDAHGHTLVKGFLPKNEAKEYMSELTNEKTRQMYERHFVQT